MRGTNTIFPVALLATAVSAAVTNTTCPATSSNSTVDLSWHAPNSTKVNDLATLFNTTGVYDYIFNSSTDPAGTPYGTYNWCNMPHVRKQEYVKAPSGFELKYVELMHRHHKRTPYASNAFPVEDYSWNCDDAALFTYAKQEPNGNTAQIYWEVYTSPSNPLNPGGFPDSNCEFPQITYGGLSDSYQHGKDLFGVYHDELGFLPDSLGSSIKFRVTNNVITSEVAGLVVDAMYPAQSQNKQYGVLIQPDSIDSLEPAYTCSYASDLYSSYSVGSTNTAWLAHLSAAASLYTTLDAISGVDTTDSGWHNWFDHYFDNLSSKLCHNKALPCNSTFTPERCVTLAEAEEVFRIGEYEYSFIYRDAPESLNFAVGSFGIWMAELAQNLRDVSSGNSTTVYRHNVAHDGSISRLLSILQVQVMVWPGMGSEAVFELYNKKGCEGNWLRILWGGKVLQSSSPTLQAEDGMIDLDVFLAYVDGLVGVGASKIPGICAQSV